MDNGVVPCDHRVHYIRRVRADHNILLCMEASYHQGDDLVHTEVLRHQVQGFLGVRPKNYSFTVIFLGREPRHRYRDVFFLC